MSEVRHISGRMGGGFGMGVTRSAVAVSAGATAPEVLETIQSRLLRAHVEDATVNYIVAGDSTRDNTYNQMIAYYTHQLAKAGVTVTDNASSGQSGQHWGANTDAPNLSQAIAATPGTGAGTILEYSFGINDDKNGATSAQVKAWLKNGIMAYRAARPSAAIVLAVPITTGNSARNANLATIYAEIGSELGLPTIDTLTATTAVHGDTDFYQDSTHPNRNGSMRVVNYILSELAHPDLYGVIDLDAEFLEAPAPTAVEMARPVESGFWSTSQGTPSVNAAWRRMQEVAVEPNFVLRTQHLGNRWDISWMTEGNVFISNTTSAVVSGQPYREVTIPATAWKARINISSAGTTYDQTGDTPSVKYVLSTTPSLTMAEINAGLTINLEDNSV